MTDQIRKNKQTLNKHTELCFDTEEQREGYIAVHKFKESEIPTPNHDVFYTKGMDKWGNYVLFITYRYRSPETHREGAFVCSMYDVT